MKGTPFKTRRLTSPFMLAEAGLGGSEGVDPVVEEENTGKKIAEFFTPESPGEAILGVLPVGGKGISKWLTKSKMGKKVLNKVPGLSKLFTKGEVVKNKPIDFSKSRDFSGKAKQMQTTGGVDAGDAKKVALHNTNINRYGQGDPNLLPTPKTFAEANKITANATKDIGKLGKRMDKAGYSIKNLDPKKSVKKIGQADSGQTIYEVTYPGGEKLRFWQSSGRGEKGIKFRQSDYQHLNNPAMGASKDYFGVLPGNMDRSLLPHPSGIGKQTDSWFVKGDGWEQGYGSDIIEDTGIWLKSLKESGIIN